MKCKICGKAMPNPAHLKKHGLTAQEYRAMFGCNSWGSICFTPRNVNKVFDSARVRRART